MSARCRWAVQFPLSILLPPTLFVFLDVVFMIRLAPQTKLWEPKDQAGSIVIF